MSPDVEKRPSESGEATPPTPDSGASQRRWHREVFARGDQSYGHLATVALEPRVELVIHMSVDHGIPASWDEFGSWCRDMEAHAEAHGVTMHANAPEDSR